jgi:hypothetical protein
VHTQMHTPTRKDAYSQGCSSPTRTRTRESRAPVSPSIAARGIGRLSRGRRTPYNAFGILTSFESDVEDSETFEGALTLRQPLDGKQVPLAGHAFELDDASLAKLDPRAGDQILDRA